MAGEQLSFGSVRLEIIDGRSLRFDIESSSYVMQVNATSILLRGSGGLDTDCGWRNLQLHRIPHNKTCEEETSLASYVVSPPKLIDSTHRDILFVRPFCFSDTFGFKDQMMDNCLPFAALLAAGITAAATFMASVDKGLGSRSAPNPAAWPAVADAAAIASVLISLAVIETFIEDRDLGPTKKESPFSPT
jgi:hypothetical protein